jgi:hypothetical protein
VVSFRVAFTKSAVIGKFVAVGGGFY